MRTRLRTLGVSLTALLLAVAGPVLAEEAIDPAEVEGTWVREEPTRDGVVRLVKVHRGGKTRLTAYDPQGNVLYAHESEYTLHRSGKARFLSFTNRRITAGPDKGRESKETTSFLYRVIDDQFIEVRGVLDDVPEPPRMILWKREKKESLQMDSA